MKTKHEIITFHFTPSIFPNNGCYGPCNININYFHIELKLYKNDNKPAFTGITTLVFLFLAFQ